MALPPNPFTLIRTEDFNTNYEIIAKYFSYPKAPYYTSLVRRGNTVLVGTRGSGKTMLLKSLYLPVQVEMLKRKGLDPESCPLDFIGVLINCERYEFKIFRPGIFSYQISRGDPEKVRHFWRQCIGHYFALLIVEEMLSTVISNGSRIGINLAEPKLNDLASEVCQILQLDYRKLPEHSPFCGLARLIKERRLEFSQLMHKAVLDLDFSVAVDRFDLSAVIDLGNALRKIPRLADVRFYILLDDFFYPNLADEQQKILLELIRVRSEPLAFKIATLPGGMVFKDDSGFELMARGDEFEVETIEYPDLGETSEYFQLTRDIVNNRLRDYNLVAENLFAESPDDMKTFLSKLRGGVGMGHVRPEYAGFGTLVHMSSGIIRTFLVLAKRILDSQMMKKGAERLDATMLPVPVEVQSEVVYSESSLFLDAIESREKGLLMSKLVRFMGDKSREKLMSEKRANEYIQLQISNYDDIRPEAQEILTRAVTNNIVHSYQASHRTTRRGAISMKSLVLNRLLTPELRIPYRDRWRLDADAKRINTMLSTESPLDTSYHRSQPERTLFQDYCPVISGTCDLINPNSTVDGCFYASPIRPDWTSFARDFFKAQFPVFRVAVEHPPRGDITCKICEMIHQAELGIYELTDLNENVVFELALALARKRHAFIVVNSEYPIEQITSLLGVEYLPYTVVKDSIQSLCSEKILPAVKSGEPSWNSRTLDALPDVASQKGVLLAMPRESPYYERTLAKGVSDALGEMGFQVVLPGSHLVGKWFGSLVRDLKQAEYCLIDTTRIPDEMPSTERFSPRYLDYLQRLFIFGLAVGLRKITLNVFNTAYGKKLFTDMQGNCYLEYSDSGLFGNVRERVPEVFHG